MRNSRAIQGKGNHDDSYTLRIPFSSIERVYGPGNFDASEEDIAQAVWDSGGNRGEVRYDIDIDSAHENPWFHSLVLTVKGLSLVEFDRLKARMVSLTLLEETDSEMRPKGRTKRR